MMTGITKKDVFKYMLLPRIAPRVKELGFNLPWLAYLMALIFSATRILPQGHPYLAKSSMGSYGIRDILYEASRHLKGGVRHIDQYLIYGSFLLGTILLIGQFIILAFIVLTHTAEAASDFNFRGMFTTPMRENDLALMMLDKIFEIPNMFGSKFNPETLAQVSPFGHALHAIFSFYNYGILCIAALIVTYFVVAVVLESTQTGSPFGERFAEVYVPFRLIIAIGLLLPLGYGFSAGQLLTLKLADYGSGLATNAWLVLNKRAEQNPLGMGAEQLLAMPKTQEIEDLIRFYALIHSCRAMYIEQYSSANNPKEIKPYLIYQNGTSLTSVEATGMSFENARAHFPNTSIRITYGEKKSDYKQPGQVKPYCGSVSIPQSASDFKGAIIIQQTFWDLLNRLWASTDLRTYGERMARKELGRAWTAQTGVNDWPDPQDPIQQGEPGVGFYANTRAELQSQYNSLMDQAKNNIRALPEARLPMDDEMLARGWGGAGIWFNKIVESNGAITSAANIMPTPNAYPAVMNTLASRRSGVDGAVTSVSRFSTSLREGNVLSNLLTGGDLDDPNKDAIIVRFLDKIYQAMTTDNTFGDGTESHDNNPVTNFVNLIFGTYGLAELRGNDEIHPLAKMSALGRSIIDRSMTYLGATLVMGGLSGLATIFDDPATVQKLGGGYQTAFAGVGKMFSAFAYVGILIGVTLYYVIPFLPFLYFFFAVGRWAKSIFEALVGIPLWALAHLRIDGDGIPGQAAANGYFLLLEIFLRPILVLFGLMAAVGCFTALAIALDTIFDLVTVNVTGYSPIDETGGIEWKNMELRRGHIDQFFYTVVYAILLYMMAMSCFKLIDLIPNSVLRFLGTGVNEFADKMEIQDDLLKVTTAATYTMGDDIGRISLQVGEISGLTAALPVNFAQEQQREQQAAEQQRQQQEQQRQQEEQQRQQQEQQRQQEEQQRPQPEPTPEPTPEPQPEPAPAAEQTPTAEQPAQNAPTNQPQGQQPQAPDAPPQGGTPPKPPTGGGPAQ